MSGRVALLDVNVLVALFDPEHVYHERAHDWFADTRHEGWATTAITENGAIRVLSNPSYHPEPTPATTIHGYLQRFCAAKDHVYWPADVSLLHREVLVERATLSHRQLTDVYLLALAVAHNGYLATFDGSVPLNVVRNAKRHHLDVLGA